MTESFETPAALAASAVMLPPEPDSRGRSSFCGLMLRLCSRGARCIARLGIMQTSCLRSTFIVFMPPSSVISLPAAESGLSNHVDDIIPPYFSVLSFT